VLEAFFKTYFKHSNKKDIITIKNRGELALCKVELVEFNDELLEGIGSYCLRSKKKSNGYITSSSRSHLLFCGEMDAVLSHFSVSVPTYAGRS